MCSKVTSHQGVIAMTWHDSNSGEDSRDVPTDMGYTVYINQKGLRANRQVAFSTDGM